VITVRDEQPADLAAIRAVNDAPSTSR